MESNKRIPVTIISGFLGAGKTTFINQVLKQNPQKKFALIENELGEISIDHQLIEAQTDTIIELNNGCICCTINHNLIETLNHLLQKYSFDHLLIETTGIAEPAGVASPFLLYDFFKQKFYLQNIIVLVDALHLEENLKHSDLPARQIAYASILIVNKLDLISPEKIIVLESIIKSLNPDAPIFFCEHAKISTVEILHHSNEFTDLTFKKLSETYHHHEHPFNSIYIKMDEPLDLLKFQHWMQMMLQIQYGRIYRIKGWVQFKGFDAPLLFQSVGKQFFLDKNPQENQEKTTQLVLIGLGLDKSKIEEILKKLK